MPIQITARRDGFRRLGIAHSANTVTWPDDHFSDSELQILEKHMSHCVNDAFASGSSQDAGGKVAELLQILKRQY